MIVLVDSQFSTCVANRMAGVVNRVGGVFVAGIASYAAYHTLHTKIWNRAEAVDYRIQAIREEVPSSSPAQHTVRCLS